MHIETLDQVPAGTALSADICIIGTGPAGATLALELAGAGISVLVVESGGVQRDEAGDRLNDIENIGAPRCLDQTIVRSRVLGGTSDIWTGRCAELDEVDFAERPWVPHSGWPFDGAALRPYLERSAAHLGLGFGAGFTGEGFWALTNRPRPARAAVDPDRVLPFFWQFSRTANPQEFMRFGPRLRKAQADNIRILTHATAVRIDTDAAATHVETLELADRADRRFTVSAGTIVLCCGGIENARLLLASNRVSAPGLGNAHDLVGRYLMDHPRGGIGRFAPTDAPALAPVFGMQTVRSAHGRHLYCQGLRLSPAIQAREGLLSCAVWLSEFVSPDDPWSAIRRLATGRARWQRDALRVLADAPMVARGLYNSLVQGGGVPRRLEGLGLNCIVEQAPDPDSRVTLSPDRKDRHGTPLPRIDWRVNEQEQRTVRRTAVLVAEALDALGLPRPALEPFIVENGPLAEDFGDVAHHIGTTRMATTPDRGVVNPDGQVHGIDGLFVAGSSVFPTGSHANPTQMIVALAIRMADHLKARTRQGLARAA